MADAKKRRKGSGHQLVAIRGIFERPPRSRTWWISYCDVEGKRHREKIGRRSAALDALARRRMEVKDGRFIPPKKGARLTFRELAMAAMVRKKLRLAPLSYRSDGERLDVLLRLIGNVPADRLTPARIEETLAALIVQRGIKKATANRYHALGSSVYKFAVDAGKLQFNPFSKVRRFPEKASRLRFLSKDEEFALRKAIADPDDQSITREVCQAHIAEFDLALNSGMRRGEQFFAKWSDVDYERRLLSVVGKTGPRHIRLNKAALNALKDLDRLKERKESPKYICPDASDEIQRDSRTWLNDALKKAKVSNFRWHDLRHTFASRSIAAGVSIAALQELLGHKTIQMTMRYAHLAPSHLQDAVEKMNEEVPA
jgi:integrase